MTREPPEAFRAAAAGLGIAFEEGELHALGRFLEQLLETNRQMNLTAITDPAAAWQRHILDSLTLLPLLRSAEVRSVLDVGSGGGLPGIPLAITMPDVGFVLLEATGKKARFLAGAARALGLANVTILNERAEQAGQDHRQWRERFDAVIARAVGALPVLLELTVPFATVGGLVLAVKGAKADEEIEASKAALHALHAAVIDRVPTLTGTIVVVEKRRRSPRLYPRAPGEPKRRPL